HVDAGLARQFEIAGDLGAVAAQAHRIGRRPHRAAAEDRHAVDDEPEIAAVGAAIEFDATEADAADRRADGTQTDTNVMKRRLAIARRPPWFDTGDIERRRQPDRRLGP